MSDDTAKFLVTLDSIKDPQTSWVKITTITMLSKYNRKFDNVKLKRRLEVRF